MTSTTQSVLHARRAQPWSIQTLLVWIFMSLGLFAVASENAASQTGEADPPSRVARLSDLSGNVWLYRPDTGEWLEATRNLPVTTGDTLATEAGARVELQVGSSTFRLDSGSELQVSALDDSRIGLQLRAGAVAVRIRNIADTGSLDISTDEGRFVVLAAGGYRFDRASRSSFAAVDSGQVRYEYGASALSVGPGQRAEFWIDASGAAQYGLGAATYDAFTAWNNERDRAGQRGGVATRYVSPEMTGGEDLDRYGNWEQTPDYGAVWIPATVSADWVPYSAGHWAWVRPWGWTWVDDAPWGFAPFHYGRWVNLRNRWCWTPGVRERRPVYAPALVGWIAPPRGGVAVGGGVGPAVGWFPLAPREVYVPAYHGSPRYIRSINTPYMRRDDNIEVYIRNPTAPREFENRRIPRAVTVVPATAFIEHRRSLAPVAAQFRDAPWAREFAQGNGPAAVVIAAPVAAPPALANRQGDPRPMRPPPGFPEQQGAAPGRPGRDREALRPEPYRPNVVGGASGESQRPGGSTDPRDFERNRLDRNGPAPSRGNPPSLATDPPVAVPQTSADTGATLPARVRPLPVRPPFDAGQRVGQPGSSDGRQPGVTATLPQQPIAPSPSVVPEERRVRPLPIGRGGERRDDNGRIGDEQLRSPMPAGVERGQDRAPGLRPSERSPQPLRPDGTSGRAEVAVPRPPESRPAVPLPPVIAPMPAPSPPIVAPMPALRPPTSPPPSPLPAPPQAPIVVPAPLPRPVEPAAPPRRVEGPPPRPAAPAVEPQRPAVPERRNPAELAR